MYEKSFYESPILGNPYVFVCLFVFRLDFWKCNLLFRAFAIVLIVRPQNEIGAF